MYALREIEQNADDNLHYAWASACRCCLCLLLATHASVVLAAYCLVFVLAAYCLVFVLDAYCLVFVFVCVQLLLVLAVCACFL